MANLAWVIPLSLWFLFCLLVVPYRLASKYKKREIEANLRLDQLTTRRLQICHDTSTDAMHIRLAVSTDCAENLEGCYAKLIDCALRDESVHEWVRCSGLQLLQPDFLFIWVENGDDHVTIAGNRSKSYVRILETGQSQHLGDISNDYFGIPTKQDMNQLVFWGTYKLIIEFGTHSNKNAFAQTVVEVVLNAENPHGTYNLSLVSLCEQPSLHREVS